MHGRLKVKTTEEQKAEKHKQQQKKLAAYRLGWEKIQSTRQETTYDPESFAISAQLLSNNPDIYTLWNYRKEVALIAKNQKGESEEEDDKLAAFLDKEVALTEQCLVANPKSYGSWHHRYWVLLIHPKPDWEKEFALCTKYLSFDDRNFHCWDYRRLIINKIGITLPNELTFSNERLDKNFSNYSSWHYRSTLLKLTESSIDFELYLVLCAIFTDPGDSSAWFYLRWVLSSPALTSKRSEKFLKSLEKLQELDPDCKWVLLGICWLTSSLVLSDSEYVDRRVQFYNDLIKLDPMRKGQYEDYLQIAENKV